MSVDIAAYLTRIGYSGTPGINLETLSELHRLHTLTIPFENLNPFLYQEVSLDGSSLSKKLVQNLRGGYCFEQNLLFAEVLKSIGFKVKGLGGRVVWNQPEETITRRSHMLLSVNVAGEEYLADVGFGGLTLTTPIKFRTEIVQSTTHEDFRIMMIDEDYKLQANVSGEWKTLYRFDSQEQHLVDYEVANYYLYTNPTSIFRINLIAAKPFDGGRYALSNTLFSTYMKDGQVQKVQLSSVTEIKGVLKNTFGIRLPEGPDLDSRLQSLF